VANGEPRASDRLFELVFEDMRRMASRMMKQEQVGHTLQPTAVVNEAALRLLGEKELGHHASRKLFFWTASRAMRRVLVDHARKRNAAKRGGTTAPVSLDSTVEVVESKSGVNLVELDEALNDLQVANERQARIVTLRFFGGFAFPEIADQLDVSLSTVEKDWRLARLWLRRRL